MSPHQVVEMPLNARQVEPFVIEATSWAEYGELALDDGWAIRVQDGVEWKRGMIRSHEFIVLSPSTPRPARSPEYHEQHLVW